MGAVAPTRFSRVSIGWRDSNKSLVDYDASDTGAVFSVTGPLALTGALTQTGAATFSSTVSIGGALTQDAAATFLSTATFGGDVTASTGLKIGNAAAVNEIVAFSSTTAAVSLGAIAPHESSSVKTIGVSGATRGDTLILTLDSIYPNAAGNTDVAWFCSSSSTVGEVHVWGINSTLTSVTPTASTVVRISRINHPSYL